MANLYRFLICIFLASLGSAFAEQVCRQVLDQDAMNEQKKPIHDLQHWNTSCPFNGYCNKSGAGSSSVVDGHWTWTMSYYRMVFGELKLQTQSVQRGQKYSPILKEICEDDPTKPVLTDWNNCKKGKDHGFSWIIIGDGNGEGESRFKREFWSCDDPEFWDTYDHPPEAMPDPKPTDPDNPDPKPGEGGDGDKPGEGDGGCIGNNCGTEGGNDSGNENGNNSGNGNGNNEGNGKGLSKGEVTEAIKDADILGCNGRNCEAGDFSGSSGDSDFADIPKSFWESKYESHDLMALYDEKIGSQSNSIVAQFSMINTDIGQGTCPVIELPGDFGYFQIDCEFLEMIRAAFIFSATLTAFFIIFRR